MNLKKLLLTLLLGFFSFWAPAQVNIDIPSGSDTTICPGQPLTMHAVTNGFTSTSVSTGIQDDDYLTTVIPIGFTFNFYGTNYTNYVISSNGYINFNTSLAGAFSGWTVSTATGIPNNSYLAPGIAGVYADLLFSNPFVSGGGGTISYGTAGVAPNRKCVIQFCDAHYYSCTGGRVSFEIILYETSNVVEVHTKRKTSCGNAIQGVENSSSTAGTATPGRNGGAWTVTTPDAYRFTPDATFTSYTCTSIPYNPIPDANATIYWYNGTTYLGSGASMTVSPTLPTTYTAAAVTCGDTVRDIVNVLIGTLPAITSITTTQPSACGLCDGSITLHGLTPGTTDTINYYLGSAAQPQFVGVANASGDLTIANVCAGTYTNFTAKIGYCTSPVYASATVAVPPFNISTSSHTNPTVCGLCNGSITINGLVPGYPDTVNYSYNGTPQLPYIVVVPASGSITIPNLCAGSYTAMTVKMNSCTANVPAITITNPSFTAASTTQTNPTVCGLCDGSITINGLVPGYSDTVNYSYNGTPQLPYIVVVPASGSITIPNLCAGSYTAMTVRMNGCTANIAAITITNPSFAVTSTTQTIPTVCGLCDGSITISGLVPGYTDTVNYSYNGVPQPPFIAVASAGGSITIPNICAGAYTSITVKMNTCIANVPNITVANPWFEISSVNHTDPSVCGACNGTITINGLIAGYTDTVNFSKDGVPQTPVILTVPASGSIVLTNLCAGTYSNITVKMNSCTTAPAGPVVLVNPAFGVSSTSSTNASCSACDGTITLNGMTPSQTVTINYSYNGVPQPSVTMTTNAVGSVTLTNLCPGTYTNITATLNTCVSSPAGPITISAPPLIPINVLAIVQPTECGMCDGRITIKGVPPGPIDTIWYSVNGVAQSPVLYSATADSTVTLFNLCEGTYSNFYIKVGPCPTTTISTPTVLTAGALHAVFSYADMPGCIFDVINFTNTSWSPTNNLWYVWHFGDGTTDTTRNPQHSYGPGTYHVTLVITNHFCVDSTSLDITIDHPVQAGFTANTVACQNVPVSFSNASTGHGLNLANPLTYQWSFGDGGTSTLQNPSHAYVNVGTYTIRLITGNDVPCYDTAYGTISIDSASTLAVTLSDTVLCRATYVTMNSIFTSVGYTGMTWNFGNGDSLIDVNPVVYAYNTTGTYTVTSTVGFRICPALTVSRTITVLPQPNISLGADTSICAGSETIQIADWINAPDATASWLWNTGETGYSILVNTPGTYTSTVTIGNCHATDSVVVSEDCYMAMPNIFTPNEDGINDYFYPRQLLSRGLTTFKMQIYNRWGQMIFSTNSVDGRGWDGKFNDVPQPEEVYVYIIDATFRDGKKEHHQGNVTLLR